MDWLQNRNKAIEIAKRQGYINAESRNRGNTLAKAFGLIKEAIENEEKEVKIIADLDMVVQHRKCKEHVCRIIESLNLEGFYISEEKNTIIYSLNENFIKKYIAI